MKTEQRAKYRANIVIDKGVLVTSKGALNNRILLVTYALSDTFKGVCVHATMNDDASAGDMLDGKSVSAYKPYYGTVTLSQE